MDTRIKVRIESVKYGTWENLQVAYDINSVKDLYLTFPTIEVILNYPSNILRKKIASESLKAFLGKDLNTAIFQGIVENRQKNPGTPKVNLLTFDDFIALAQWEAAINGNVEVAKVLAIGFAESFRNLALRQLGVDLGVDEQLAWLQARMKGKYVRRTLTDSIKEWIDRNGTSCPSHFMYATCTNQIYQALTPEAEYAKRQLKETWQQLRDAGKDTRLYPCDRHIVKFQSIQLAWNGAIRKAATELGTSLSFDDLRLPKVIEMASDLMMNELFWTGEID